MRVRLVSTTRSRRGVPAHRTERVEVEVLRVGRGTDNAVQLPSLAVSLHHCAFHARVGGVYLEALGDAEVRVGGRLTEGQTVAPGDVVRVGPFELRVLEPEGDEAFALEVERTESPRSEQEELALRTRIGVERGWLSRRRLAWSGAALTVLLFVGAPLVLGILRQSWSSGPLSHSHSFVEEDCEICHGAAFARVRDEACLRCHAQVGAHAPQDVRAAALDRMRCTACHAEHRGRLGLAWQGRERCAACHADLERVAPGSRVPRASDFGRDHPALRVVLEDPQGGPSRRAELSPELRERSGLAFSHLRHVGQVVVDPRDGKKRNQTCAECHVLDEAGRGMKPVSFEAHCRGCHDLAFEEGREALHGDPVAMRQDILEYYAARAFRAAAGADDGRRARARPGRALPERERAMLLERVTREARQKSDFLMRGDAKKAPCAECHEVLPGGAPDGGDGVAPVRVARSWMRGARFRHAAHAPFPCARCHVAAAVYDPDFAPEHPRPAWSQPGAGPHALLTPEELRARHAREPSKESADVLLPDIAVCRECHAGAAGGGADRVPSDCVLCHPFHREEHGPLRPGAAPRGEAAWR